MNDNHDHDGLRRTIAHWPKHISEPYAAWATGKVSPRPETALRYAQWFSGCLRASQEIGLDVTARNMLDVWTVSSIRQLATHMRSASYSVDTIRNTIISIERVICAVLPDASRAFIARQLKTIPRKSSTRKSGRLRTAVELCHLGFELMEEANSSPLTTASARLYRSGLEIALLALRPYRFEIFCSVRIAAPDDTREPVLVLRSDHGEYFLTLLDGRRSPAASRRRPARNLSGGKFVNKRMRVPTVLTKHIDDYLGIYRPLLVDGAPTDRLWVHKSIYKTIIQATREKFGQSICPQWFRDCYVLSAGRHELDMEPHRVLGNSASMTGDRYTLSDPARTIAIGNEISAELERYFSELDLYLKD